MELNHSIAALALAGLLALTAGCADHGFEVTDEGLTLPAPLERALVPADAFAKDWDEDAYLWEMGGGYTTTDAQARGYDHTFRFYSPARERRLDVHLFAGSIWAEETVQPRPVAARPLFGILPAPITSEEAMALAVTALGDSLPAVPMPHDFSARLSSVPVWPERLQSGAVTDSVAWRIDALEKRFNSQGLPVWWSLVRIYVHPGTGEVFEVVNSPQVYPNL
jgi:hypothetical protein